MGFRNPATTASAVDTGHGLANPGVRLFQDTSNPSVPQGIAEWRTGLMDRNARITLAGGSSGGSGYVIDGGAAVGVDAPKVELNVESGAGGGYVPILRLMAGAGGAIHPDVVLDPVVPHTLLAINLTNFAALDPAETLWSRPYYVKEASGWVTLGGMLVVTSTSFGGGTVVVSGLPAGCRPAKQKAFSCLGWNGAQWRADLHPDGTVQWNGNGPGATSSNGAYLSLEGIAFHAEA